MNERERARRTQFIYEYVTCFSYHRNQIKKWGNLIMIMNHNEVPSHNTEWFHINEKGLFSFAEPRALHTMDEEIHAEHFIYQTKMNEATNNYVDWLQVTQKPMIIFPMCLNAGTHRTHTIFYVPKTENWFDSTVKNYFRRRRRLRKNRKKYWRRRKKFETVDALFMRHM